MVRTVAPDGVVGPELRAKFDEAARREKAEKEARVKKPTGAQVSPLAPQADDADGSKAPEADDADGAKAPEADDAGGEVDGGRPALLAAAGDVAACDEGGQGGPVVGVGEEKGDEAGMPTAGSISGESAGGDAPPGELS